MPAGRRAERLHRPLLAAAAVALAAAALHLRDPHRHTWLVCPFHALTGWDCPGCGGLRAVNDLGNGRLLDAAQSNLPFVLSLPVVAVVWVLWTQRAWSGRPLHGLTGRRTTAWLLGGYGALVIGFTVFRNTPWGSAFHVS